MGNKKFSWYTIVHPDYEGWPAPPLFRLVGPSIYVSGEMNFRNYTDQDGNARSIAELNADSIQLLTPRNSIAAGTPYASQPEQQQGAPAENFEGDDDLPF